MDNGGPVCQNMLEFEPGEMFGFQMKNYGLHRHSLRRYTWVMGRVERGSFTLTLSQNRA